MLLDFKIDKAVQPTLALRTLGGVFDSAIKVIFIAHRYCGLSLLRTPNDGLEMPRVSRELTILKICSLILCETIGNLSPFKRGEGGGGLLLELPPHKMLHDIKPVKYLGARSWSKLSKLENAPSCVLILQNDPGACSWSKTPLV